jgi:hypothetical protein
MASPMSQGLQSDGKTVITLRQLHPTKSQRDATIGFGAAESIIRPSTSWRYTSKTTRLFSDIGQIWHALSASVGTDGSRPGSKADDGTPSHSSSEVAQ